MKWNFFDSTDGKLSVSLIPYVKAPVARMGVGNGAFEGGLILPIDYKLTDKITLGTVPGVDVFKDSLGDGRHLNTAQLINLGYSLPKNVTLYGELWGDWNFDPVKEIDQYSADVAASWGVSNYIQFDAGLNFGLNRSTPGVQGLLRRVAEVLSACRRESLHDLKAKELPSWAGVMPVPLR